GPQNDMLASLGGHGSLFGGPDPFKEFSAMPFGGAGGLGNFGGGSMMPRGFDDLAAEMMRGFGGQQQQQQHQQHHQQQQRPHQHQHQHRHPTAGSARGGAMAAPSGSFACQSFAMSSVMGPDGKMHTERYVSSDVGNTQHGGVREAQHAYSNSSTKSDKMALERHLGGRARKVVRELDRNTLEERSKEMLRGMSESGRDSFDRDFAGQANLLPQHQRFNAGALPGQRSLGGHANSRHQSLPGADRRY
ncbi:unnamed protein product, partial [Polarella glacialis]